MSFRGGCGAFENFLSLCFRFFVIVCDKKKKIKISKIRMCARQSAAANWSRSSDGRKAKNCRKAAAANGDRR
jgi:hypothetical protein